MDNTTNQQILNDVYRNYAAGDMAAVLAEKAIDYRAVDMLKLNCNMSVCTYIHHTYITPYIWCDGCMDVCNYRGNSSYGCCIS